MASASKVLWILGGLGGCGCLGFLALFAAFLLLHRVDVPVYTHAATADLFKTYDLDAPELAACSADGVTVRAALVQGHPQVQVSFLSKTGGSLSFEHLAVAGRGSLEAERQEVDVGSTLELTPSTKGPLQTVSRSVSLGLSSAEWDALGAEGYRVVVRFRVGAGPSRAIELAFDRVVKTAIAWPT